MCESAFGNYLKYVDSYLGTYFSFELGMIRLFHRIIEIFHKNYTFIVYNLWLSVKKETKNTK